MVGAMVISRTARVLLAIALAGCGGPPVGGGRVAPTPVVVASSAPASPAVTVVGRAPVAADGGRTRVTADQATADAIAKLEAFIAAHGDQPAMVADALLRLGAIHLDVADDAVERDDEAAVGAATRAAIAALTRLVDRYPTDPRHDDALYLLGYARQQGGDRAGALVAYEAVAARPDSSHALEARFRVGELHFEAGELDAAVAAYAAVAGSDDDRFAPIARYKLGWSHYKRGAYPDAIAAFQVLVDLADGGATGAAADLRIEAIEYLALSLTEADWDGDGADDRPPPGAPATATVARVDAYLGDASSPSRRAAAEKAADALVDEARYPEARAIYRLVLDATAEPAARARLTASLARLGTGS